MEEIAWSMLFCDDIQVLLTSRHMKDLTVGHKVREISILEHHCIKKKSYLFSILILWPPPFQLNSTPNPNKIIEVVFQYGYGYFPYFVSNFETLHVTGCQQHSNIITKIIKQFSRSHNDTEVSVWLWKSICGQLSVYCARRAKMY